MPDLTEYDLFEDVIAKLRFGALTRAEQHAQLRRVARFATLDVLRGVKAVLRGVEVLKERGDA